MGGESIYVRKFVQHTNVFFCLQKNTFNMRQVLLNHLTNGQRSNTHPLIRHTHPPLSRLRNRSVTNAAKSLDILRQNLQASINKEIDAVLKKYLEVCYI